MTSAASYMVEVSPANADRVNVTGTATLGGATVNARFAPGSYVTRQYTIVNAAGGMNRNVRTASQHRPAVEFHVEPELRCQQRLSQSDAELHAAGWPQPQPAGRRQRAGRLLQPHRRHSAGVRRAFSTGLTAASGETGTGSQQATFDAMGQFMGVMTDPFVDGRGNRSLRPAPMVLPKMRWPMRPSAAPNDALAAIYRKAPPAVAAPLQRWSVWGAGYGGSQTTDGNAVTGSSNATSRIHGLAVGADYRISPSTLAGFALAGGGTSFNVNGQGSGRSDLFQAGAFIRHTVGASYFTGAIAYGWQDITTDRTVTAGGIEQLRAQFDANAFSGRIEAGHRFVAPAWAALASRPMPPPSDQLRPAVLCRARHHRHRHLRAELRGEKATASRGEIGLRGDKSFALTAAILTLRGRAAWAHDFNPDRSIAATFQALPGATFVVNGAAPARNAALTTAAAEIKWANGISLAASFEGEFSDVTRSYAGKGVAKFQW